jgi:hypothetical protein
MRPIRVSIVVAAGLVWCGSLTFAGEADQAMPPMHKHLMTTVEKVQSGLVFFKPTAGLQNRAVSVPRLSVGRQRGKGVMKSSWS